jgi:hypothetical protein
MIFRGYETKEKIVEYYIGNAQGVSKEIFRSDN